MSKVELTIKTNYLPNWGVYEGVRELLQNGKDAESQFSAPLDVRHRSDTDTLVIENDGATLPREALLFGHTTKQGNGEMIGKFGEGLKLGVLALVRSGYPVKIRSGAEVWLPKIERSEKFDADVLVFYVEKGRQPKERVQVEIGNITKEDWDTMKGCFLFLNKMPEDLRIDTYYGSLLLGDAHKGKLFVKGIFVQNDPQLDFGYDLTKDVDVDRDRKMVNKYDMEWRMRSIWQHALSSDKGLALHDKYLEMVARVVPSADIANLDNYGAAELPGSVREKAVANFKSRHGENAVPVENLADSKDVEHLGKKGVLVNKSLRAVLETILGSTAQIKASLANEAVNFYGYGDLSAEERLNLEDAVALVNPVEPVNLDTIDVVDFRSATVLGMYKESRVLLAKNRLSDRNVTLETLVHEVAHRRGGDGEHAHVAAIEAIWSGIVANLRK